MLPKTATGVTPVPRSAIATHAGTVDGWPALSTTSRRTGESVVDSAGLPSTVPAFVAMALRGAGVTPVAVLGSNQLVLSVNKP